MEKFKLGDRVMAIEDIGSYAIKGKKGTIVIFEYGDIGVEFDEDVKGHSCDDKAKSGHGLWLKLEHLKKLDKPTVDEIFAMPIGTKITTNRIVDNVFIKSYDGDFNNENTLIYKSDLTDDLKIKDYDCGTKILKIEVPSAYDTVYEAEEEVKEMTMEEISKALGYEVKIIKEEKCND